MIVLSRLALLIGTLASLPGVTVGLRALWVIGVMVGTAPDSPTPVPGGSSLWPLNPITRYLSW